MARRHFDEAGLPKLDFLVEDILRFSGQEICDVTLHLTDLLRRDGYSTKQICDAILYGQIFSFDTMLPVVRGIYVVGSQALNLPGSFLKGDHDIDVLMRTTATKQHGFAECAILKEVLGRVLNDERAKGQSREFFIDIYDEALVGELHAPYFQIYQKPQ